MIWRQFHNKVRRLTLEKRMLKNKARYNTKDNTCNVNIEYELTGILREKRRREQDPNRELSSAAHKRRHKDR